MNMMIRIAGASLFTFLLGYTLSTATAGSGDNNERYGGAFVSPDESIPSDAPDDTSAVSRPVETAEVYVPHPLRTGEPNVISRPDALAEVFRRLCSNESSLRVLHLGDSHVAGRVYPNTVKQTLEDAWGKADSTGYGISYKYFARNGATTQYFATAEWMRKIAAEAPDLIILSFGTNESHSMKYNEEVHRNQLTTFYGMLREACPDATVMLTTPPGDYLSARRVRYVRRNGRKRRRVVNGGMRENPMVARCAAEIERFGEEHGLPVWNLNTLAGGDEAAGNWMAARLMRPDRVHFTPEGYRLQGQLLADAILTTYNEYIKQ